MGRAAVSRYTLSTGTPRGSRIDKTYATLKEEK